MPSRNDGFLSIVIASSFLDFFLKPFDLRSRSSPLNCLSILIFDVSSLPIVWVFASLSLSLFIKMSDFACKKVGGFGSIEGGCCILCESLMHQCYSSVRASMKSVMLSDSSCGSTSLTAEICRVFALAPVEAAASFLDVCSLIAGRSDTWWMTRILLLQRVSPMGLWSIFVKLSPACLLGFL